MRQKFSGFAALALNAAIMLAAATGMAGNAQANQQTPEPIRWPQFQREPEPRPLPQQANRHRPGSSLGWGSYGRSPGGGTTTGYRRWPRSGQEYPPPYGGNRQPEPVRWPEYRQ